MKQNALLVLIILAVMGAVFAAPRRAHAAKFTVTWTAPTLNDDGSKLTNLTGYRLEWGSCTAAGAFGVYQAGINVGATVTSAPVYPTGLNPVCFRIWSIASGNVLSAVPAYTSTIGMSVLPTLSQPVHK